MVLPIYGGVLVQVRLISELTAVVVEILIVICRKAKTLLGLFCF